MPEYTEFQLKDLTVISVLWTYRLVSWWLYSLGLHTFIVVYPDKEVRAEYFYYVDFWIFFAVCGGTLFGAVLADTIGHRYTMTLIGLCLCCSSPVIGVVACVTKALPAIIFMFLTIAAINVASPSTYSLIFNQNLEPKRRHARFVVSFYECMENLLGKYFAYISIPSYANGTDKELQFIVVLWVMFAPLIAFLIVLSDRIKKLVAGDFVNEKGIKRVWHGILADIKKQPPRRNGKSLTQVVFFLLLLLPSLCVTSLGAALETVNSDEESVKQSVLLKHISLSTSVLIIPFTEFVLTLIPVLKETSREILIVGFAHVVNITVLCLIFIRLDNLPVQSPNNDAGRVEFKGEQDTPERLRGDSEVCVDPEKCSVLTPNNGVITFILMATVNSILQADPLVFIPESPYNLNSLKLIHGSYKFPESKPEMLVNITYRLNSPEYPKVYEKTLTLVEKKHYTIIVSSDKPGHIKFYFGHGVEVIKPTFEPQIILFNSICNKMINGVVVVPALNEYTVEPPRRIVPFTPPCTFTVARLQIGAVKVSYDYRGSNRALAALLNKDSARFEAEPLGVYIAFVLFDSTQLFLHVRRLYKPESLTTTMTTTTLSPVTSSIPSTPSKNNSQSPINIEAAEQSAYALSGAALGIASVGYTHFFWVESPVRLRAVLYALFKVSNDLVRWTTTKVIGKSFTQSTVVGLLSIQVVTTVWHLSLSWIFQTHIIPPTLPS